MRSDPSPNEHPDRAAGVLLALACALSLVRFVRLGEWSLWIDEALTWSDAHHSLDSSELFNPIGYRLVTGVAALFGAHPDEAALRFVPALAGVLCVPLTAWALRPLLGARRASWAALFLAVSSWALFWSQTARFYTLAQLTVLVGAGFALRGLWIGGRARTYVGLGICGASAAFHPSGAMVIPALALGAWIAGGDDAARRRRAREACLVLVVMGLAALPLALGPLKNHLLHKPAAGALSGVVHLAQTVAYFCTPLLLAAGGWAAWRAFRRDDPSGRFLAGAVIAGFACAAAIATRAQVTAQYVFVLLPFVCGLAACALRRPDEGLDVRGGDGRSGGAAAVGRAEGALALGLVAASLANCALYLTTRAGERPRWRDAYQYVAAARQPGDLVAGMAAPIGEYYLGAEPTDLRRSHAVAPIDRFFTDGPGRWRRDGRRTWIVVRPQWFADLREGDAARLSEFLARDCRMVRRFDAAMDGRDLDLLVYLEGE